MFIIPIHKYKILKKDIVFNSTVDSFKDTVTIKIESTTQIINKKHNYELISEGTNTFVIQDIPVNLTGITSIVIEGTTIQVSISNNDCIIQIGSNNPVTINNLTDKSQLLLKPQLIDNISYWTIVYNDEIVDKFPAEKMPNNYINNMMFDVKDTNVDSNNRPIFIDE